MKLEALEFPFWFDADRPGAAREQIDELEREVSFALPEELRKALMIRDGGTPSYSSYQRDDSYIPLPSFLSLDDMRRSAQHCEQFGTPAGILVIASGAHEWLGLDYRHGAAPHVVFQEREDSPLELVADSFESLLVTPPSR